MVGARRLALAALAAMIALPAPSQAKSPRDQMFPSGATCYARDYSSAHLADHPVQRVTSIALSPESRSVAGLQLQLWVTVTVRDWSGEPLLALAYCGNTGTETLTCMMEGDAGSFGVTPAKGGAVLVTVSGLGMGFEGERGFVTLERNRGDDRSFLLQPTRNCR